MVNSICTNGYLLEKIASDIGPNLDLALVSIDAMREDHDTIRGFHGLYEKVISGIMALESYPNTRINIWTTINPKSIYQLREILNVAKELKAVVEFFPVTPIPGYNDDTILPKTQIISAFMQLKSLKREGFPVANTNYYLDTVIENKRFLCNFPLISIFLNPDGTLYTCEKGGARIIKEWGKWPVVSLKELFASKEFYNIRKQMSHCNQCYLPCAVETSGFLPLQIIRKKLSILLRKV